MVEVTTTEVTLSALQADVNAMRGVVGKLTAIVTQLRKDNDTHAANITALRDEVADAGTSQGGIPRSVVLRYLAAADNVRTIEAAPAQIAFAFHLMHVKDVPQRQIVLSGLMTQSRLSSLAKWEAEFMLDYFLIHGVQHIYEQGAPDEMWGEWVENTDKLRQLIQSLPSI